jgi:hypothetical protein
MNTRVTIIMYGNNTRENYDKVNKADKNDNA